MPLLLFSAVSPAAEPTVPELIAQAQTADEAGDREGAVALLGRVIEAEPDNARWRNARGSLHFRLGHIAESITDFDKAIALDPRLEPHHWQRGISYYYAGEYEKGAKQFELHRTVNPDDVENAVWHFMCVAKWKGVEEARKVLIPIEGDGRVPMMEVHALFAGKKKPEDVLSAANAGDPSAEELKGRLFYAHLYLGLYHEALGEKEKSAEHITLAVEKYPEAHYMGDVARVHREVRDVKIKVQEP